MKAYLAIYGPQEREEDIDDSNEEEEEDEGAGDGNDSTNDSAAADGAAAAMKMSNECSLASSHALQASVLAWAHVIVKCPHSLSSTLNHMSAILHVHQMRTLGINVYHIQFGA